MTPDEILEANLRALFTRAYVPVRPASAFKARLLRELAPAAPQAQRRWSPLVRVAAAALILAVLGLALHFALPRKIEGPELSHLRQDQGAWRAFSPSESARGIEYGQGELELVLAPQRASERVWIGAHGALRLEQGGQIALSGGALAPHFELSSGRAHFERVESGGDWEISCAGTEIVLASGALRVERQSDEVVVLLESGSATYGPARTALLARRELRFRAGTLIAGAATLDEQVRDGARTAFPLASVPAAEPPADQALPALHLAGRLSGPDGTPWTKEFTLVALRDEHLPEVARPILHAFHDAQGMFDFPLTRAGRTTLFVLAEGCATVRRAGLEPAAQPKALELRLETGCSLRGRVLDAAGGAPIAGATVVSEDDAPTQILAFEAAELPAELRARAQTDAEGRFVLEHLSSGLHTLRATAPQHGASWSTRLDARSAPGEVELRLGSGGTIEAQVEPPQAGLPLVASAVDYSFQRPCLSYSLATTDALGHARFERLPPGPFVVLRAEPGVANDVSFTFVREGGSCDVLLGRVATDHVLAGRLVDPDGTAVADMNLMLQATEPQDEHWRSTRTDAAGRFRFEGVRSGAYSLLAGDLGRNFVEIDQPRVGTLDVVRELVLPRGAIVGHVRIESSGAALAQAWLILQRKLGGEWRFAGKTQADDQGAWRFPNLAPGTWRVVAYAQSERLAPSASQTFEVRLDSEPFETEVALAPGAALELHVLEPTGQPCPGAQVELRDEQGELWKFSPADVTDPAGRFGLAGIRPGTWTIRAGKLGAGESVRRVQLEVDQLSTVEIHLVPR